MKSTTLIRVGILIALVLTVAVASSQDLVQDKTKKRQQIDEIDKKIKAGASGDEYEALMKERNQLVDEIREIDKKLMADQDAMKKINAVKKAYNDGNTALRLGQYDQAITDYNKALSLDSTFTKAYYAKGFALNKKRQYREAAAAYQAAVRHNASYTDAYLSLGKIYSARMGDPDKAIEIYKTALENDPTSHRAFYELGAIYQNNKKNFELAVENFQKATQLKPDYDLAYFSLGVSLTELSRLDQAIRALENAKQFASRKNWSDPDARLAVVYNKKGACSSALASAKQALAMKKNDTLANYEAGKAAKCLGQFDQAVSYFQIVAKDRQWKKTAEYEIDMILNREKYGGNN